MRFTFRLFGEEILDIEIGGGQAEQQLAELEQIIESFVEDEEEPPDPDVRPIRGVNCTSCGRIIAQWRSGEEPTIDDIKLLRREHDCDIATVDDWLGWADDDEEV